MKEAIEAGINHRVAGEIMANDKEKQMWQEYVSDDIMRAEMGLFEGVIQKGIVESIISNISMMGAISIYMCSFITLIITHNTYNTYNTHNSYNTYL